MPRQSISIHHFNANPYGLWEDQWLLLTSGDFSALQFNSMTVAWGSIGAMWNRPFVQVVVRPARYTYQFMEKYPTFTLCAFPEEYRPALSMMGSRSGRNVNKVDLSGLTPIASTTVAAPCYAEASLVIECTKIYWDDLDPARFIEKDIHDNYPARDYHRIYFGEINAIQGSAEFSAEK